MPLNVPKNYLYKPTQVGPVKIQTRSSTRAKLTQGDCTFIARETGQSGNFIRLSIIKELGVFYFVQEHTQFLASAQVNIPGNIEVFSLNLNQDEVIKIRRVNGELTVVLVNGTETVLGKCILRKLFSTEKLSFKLLQDNQEIVLSPRVHRTTLETSETLNEDGSTSAQVIVSESLGASLQADSLSFVKMLPVVSSPEPGNNTNLTEFPGTFMLGGDGLPVSPVGMNQGPERTLILLNYGELETGVLGVLNEMYEWVGESSTKGEWKRYS